MKILSYVLSLIVFVALAAIYGVIFWYDYGVWAIAAWVAMILAIPFSSFLHELGHILFGAICKIKAKPHFSILGSSSCEIMPKTDKNLKVRVIVTALGGIIVNMLVWCISYILDDLNVLPSWCAVLIPANAYLLILNAFPAHLAAGKTDGLVVNELLQNSNGARVLLAVLTVQAQVLNGKPIEEVDRSLLFDVPQIQEDDPAFISLTELRYEYFAARGDIENAGKYKTRFEELKKEYM